VILHLLADVVQGLIALLAGYTLLTALPGLRAPRAETGRARGIRFVVAIPAHDEERVVGNVVADILASDYPQELFEVWVVADGCSDGTADVARRAGASVLELTEPAGGKAAALRRFLESREPPSEAALVVVDADNRVPASLLARFSQRLDAGCDAVQAYLDATNPESSWVSLAGAMSYWASNRMVQLARANLGWPVDLGGTGMCVTAGALEGVKGFEESLVEDQDLTVRLSLAGRRIAWIHGVRVLDEKPSTVSVAVRQRARWAAGRRGSARRHVGPLLRSAWKRRCWGHADLAIRLLQPSRTVIAAVSATLAVTSAALGAGSVLWAWPVWAVIAGLQVLAPIPFLARDGVPWRWIARYPVLALLVVLWLPVQVISRRASGWYHTPHRG